MIDFIVLDADSVRIVHIQMEHLAGASVKCRFLNSVDGQSLDILHFLFVCKHRRAIYRQIQSIRIQRQCVKNDNRWIIPRENESLDAVSSTGFSFGIDWISSIGRFTFSSTNEVRVSDSGGSAVGWLDEEFSWTSSSESDLKNASISCVRSSSNWLPKCQKMKRKIQLKSKQMKNYRIVTRRKIRNPSVSDVRSILVSDSKTPSNSFALAWKNVSRKIV